MLHRFAGLEYATETVKALPKTTPRRLNTSSHFRVLRTTTQPLGNTIGTGITGGQGGRMLALYCLKHDLPIWEKPSDCELELTCIQSRLNNLDQDIRREKNRLEGGVECRLVQEDIEENIVRLKFRAEKLEKAAKQLIRDNAKLKADFEILKSIIGIGDKSAIRLLASVSFDDFETGRKVASFAGLTPPKYQSGTSINSRRRISRMGNQQLRRGLFMPAMVAMQHNPQLRRFAERLAARNKPPKVIIIAVMRKLLALAAALLRKREFYDPTFS
jgi:transposase